MIGWWFMLNDDVKSMALHAVAGIAGGVASYAIQNSAGVAFALLAGALLLLATGYVTRAVIKEKKSGKWWLSNGAVAYVFVWLIVWTTLYNL